MTPTNVRIPVYLQSTYQMLQCAFPEGVHHDTYFPLLAILEEQMSHRNIAEVLSVFMQKEYAEILNDVYSVTSINAPLTEAIIKLKLQLQACQYQSWLAED